MKILYLTLKRAAKIRLFIVWLFLFPSVYFNLLYAQQTVASLAPSTGANQGVRLVGGLIGSFSSTGNTSIASVTDAPNAADASLSTYARLRVANVNVLGLAEYFGQAWIQLKYPTSLTANKTNFIKIDVPMSSGIKLPTLDLLNLLGSAVSVEAYNGATASTNGTRINPSQVSYQIVKDINGTYYVAVTSAAAYNSVRVYLTYSSGLLGLSLGSSYTMNVYQAFYEAVVPGNCGTAWATDEGEVTGVSLNLSVLKSLGLSLNNLVTDPSNAIDNNLNSASVLSPGAVSVAGTVSQTVFFKENGRNTDAVRMILSLPPSLLQAGIANSITFQAYNGQLPVGPERTLAEALLDLDLLGLFSSNAKVPVYYTPGGQFDRIKINFSALLGAGGSILGGGLSVYDILRVPARAVIQNSINDTITICLGEAPVLSVVQRPGETYKWYNEAFGGTVIQQGVSYTPLVTDLGAGVHRYYVAASLNGCASESERTRITIVVNAPAQPSDITLNDIIICEGSDAVLTPGNALLTAPLYKWYKDNAKTQPISNGMTEAGVSYSIDANGALTVSGLPPGTSTYYVSLRAASRCENVAGNLKAVNLLVNSRPELPQIAASATNIISGQSVVLTASSTTPGVTYRWYSSLSGTTAIYSGNPFITAPLIAASSFYVESVASNGCASAVRAQVNIQVTPPPGGPSDIPCEAAITSLQTGVDGVLAIGAGVINPMLAVDNNTATGSTLAMPLGLAASVYQRIGFNGLSSAGDTVRVFLRSTDKLLSLSLLSGITLTSYNGNSSNNDETLADASIIHLELLSGGEAAVLEWVPLVPFNGIRVKLLSGLAGALSSVNLNYAQRVIASPVLQAVAPTVCTGTAANINVQNPQTGLIYRWYDQNGNYLVSSDGSSFNTGPLTASASYYAEAVRNGCASGRTRIDISLVATPLQPVLAVNNINVCAGSDALIKVQNIQPGLIYKWYDINSVYQVGKDGTQFLVSGVTGNTTYYVEAVNSCNQVSSRTQATITSGSLDAPLINPVSITISTGSQAVLQAASPAAGAIFKWYDGNGVYQTGQDGPVFLTPVLTAGIYTYSVEVITGTCTSVRTSVTITVTGLPSLAVPCEGASAQINGVDGVLAIGAGVFNENLAIDNNANTGSLLSIPLGVAASVWQRVSFPGISQAGDTLRFKISSPAKLLSVGVLPSIVLTTYSGATSNNDAVALAHALVYVEILSDGSSAIVTYIPGNSFDGMELRLNGGLAAVLSSLEFNYAQRKLAAPAVTADASSLCAGSSGTLRVVSPEAGVTYQWYKEGIYQSGQDGAMLNTGALTGGIHNYSVIAVRNGCPAAPVAISIQAENLPAVPIPATGNPASVCEGSEAVLQVQQITGVSYNWYNNSGTLVALNSATYTTPSSLPAGSYTYRVEAIGIAGCASASRATIAVQVNREATLADIIIQNKAVCEGTVVTLAPASTIANPAFSWYTDAAGTQPILNGVSAQGVLTLSNLAAGNYTYYVRISGSQVCASPPGMLKPVQVIVSASLPLSAVTVTNNAICSGSSANLMASANGVINPVYEWYTDEALTDRVAATPQFITPSLAVSRRYYVRVTGDNLCSGGTTKEVMVTVSPVPDGPSVAADGTTTCVNQAATLRIDNADINLSYNWYSAASGGVLLQTGSVFTTPALAVRTSYYVGSGNGSCFSQRTRVDVEVVSQPPAPVIAAGGHTVCKGQPTQLAVNEPKPELIYHWYDAANGGNLLFTGTSYTTNIINNNTTLYVAAALATGCNSTSRTPVSITANDVPGGVALIQPATQLCSGGQVTLQVNNPVTGYTYNWYLSLTGGTSVHTGTSYTISNISSNATYYVEAINALGCRSGIRTAGSVTLLEPLPAPVISVEATTTNTVTFRWSAVPGATGYEVSRDGGASYVSVGQVLTYTVNGLQPNTEVSIQVRSLAAGVCQTSALSARVNGRTNNPLGNEIYIPNAFTPNGDGRNDLFMVYGTTITSVQMIIYNQYGELIWEKNQNGWDGTHNGRQLASGVYVYSVRITFQDGSKLTKNGTVNLIR